MNCKHVEDLLPLYAGHDLGDESARLIAAHLQNCTACASSAREFDQANQLLQQFEPPQFSDAAYATVRRNVLREIQSGSSAFSLRELLVRPFQPRVRWALSTAVLLVVCAFAYYLIADRSGVHRDQTAGADTQPAAAGTAGAPPAWATSSPNPELNTTVQPEIAIVRPTLVKASNRRRLNLTASTSRHSPRAGGAPAVPVNVVQYLPEPPNIKPLKTAVTSDKSLRVEIQTKDPNIRIIWFSHPSTNEGSPNESSRGI